MHYGILKEDNEHQLASRANANFDTLMDGTCGQYFLQCCFVILLLQSFAHEVCEI